MNDQVFTGIRCIFSSPVTHSTLPWVFKRHPSACRGSASWLESSRTGKARQRVSRHSRQWISPAFSSNASQRCESAVVVVTTGRFLYGDGLEIVLITLLVG
jgi:hypothetical protein